MGVVALLAAATDRFYIEDFSLAAGETKQVCIQLDNEIEYTAFQCDIYLPEGLTVEQEDGFYVIELSDRKARSHILYVALQQDGAIRLLCYSSNVSPFKDSGGVLVYMNVVASDDFVGPKTILIKNTRFGTPSGEEIQFPDDTCIVTSTSPSISGDVNGDGEVNIADINAVINIILGGTADEQTLERADVNGDGEVNIADINAVINLILS